MQFFRNIFKSKVGAALAILLLVLIALAFASADVSNTGAFGGVAGGNRVAQVGDEKLDTATLSQAVTAGLDRVKQDDPTMSMKAFLAGGGLEDILDDLIDRLAIAVFGKENGFAASDRLIDSEIAQMAAFKGADGRFSQDQFRQLIQQRGISEAMLRDDLMQGLIARQVMMPASVGSVMPTSMVKRYATLLLEKRTGAIAVLPSDAFAPKGEPSEAALAAYYKDNIDSFIRPERRIIRYATFGPDFLKNAPGPTDAEIAARYKKDAARYAASERRSIEQVVVPTEAAAKALAAEVSSGTALSAAASEKGLTATKTDLLSRSDLAEEFSPALANAAFAAAQGALVPPAKSALGWHVAWVDRIDTRPARSLESVKGEIAQTLSAEKRRTALTDALERIESGFDEGGNLAEAAQSVGAQVQVSKPLTADGRVYQSATEKAPDTLAPVLATAFSMQEQEPQLAEVERGKTFMVYDVQRIVPSAAAPLADIKDGVKQEYLREQGSIAARKAALAVQAKVAKGMPLAKALAELDTPVPPARPVAMGRPELARMQQQNQPVPRPLALLFSMAEGTVKVQPAPGKRGWFIVSLTDIEPGKVEDDNPIIAAAQQQLGQSVGGEYSDALGRAIRSEVGVERNPAAIRSVRDQLGGNAGAN